jgi:hypothetical protein
VQHKHEPGTTRSTVALLNTFSSDYDEFVDEFVTEFDAHGA